MIPVKLDSLIAVTTNVSLHDMYTFAKQYLSNIIIPNVGVCLERCILSVLRTLFMIFNSLYDYYM